MLSRVRRYSAGAIAACVACAGFGLVARGPLGASPLVTFPFRLPFGPARSALAGSAAPKPTAAAGAARPRRSRFGSGPIVLRGDGTYQVTMNRSSRNGLSAGLNDYASALSVVAQRRTEQTAMSISSAFGYGGSGFLAGALVGNYRTPSFSLNYGQIAGPSDTQLQIGGFTRGVSISKPLRSGDLEYVVATAQQTDRTTYRVYGVRRSFTVLGGFLSATGFYGRGEQNGGRESIADVDFKRYGRSISTDAELALSGTSGISGTPSGERIAAALRVDLPGRENFTTIALQFHPAGFQTISGSIAGGFSADAAVRRHTDRFGDLDLALGHSDSRVDADVQHDDRLTLSGGRSWSRVALQYVLGFDSSRLGGVSTLQRNSALTFDETLPHQLSLFETIQRSSVGSGLGEAGQSQIAVGAGKSLLGGYVAYQVARSGSVAGSSLGDAFVQTLSFRRPVGRKLDFGLTQSFQTSSNNGVISRVADTGISVQRRLSSAVAVQVVGDVFRQTGPGGGRGASFNASLVGPFGFGQPRDAVGGRANPNLPGVIHGLVTYSMTSNAFAYNASPSRGYNNAIVILDGRVSQRTDATGQFEFRFVPAGTHTIRLDAATIAPGLVVDREYDTIALQGGQTATVQFNIGNFAGINGSVTAPGADGKSQPVAGVGIAVDGTQAVVTAPDGRYSIGKLSAGPHSVEIVESTLPSTVALVGDRKKAVTVSAGAVTAVSFVATRLGSISGSVVAPADGGFGAASGLKNVYVVAQPGEHAVITDESGGFVLDNLPPGAYSLALDPDTVPDGLSVLSGPDGTIQVGGGGEQSGVLFRLGPAAKAVVYTYNDGHRQPIAAQAEPKLAPPGARLRIVARSDAKELKKLVVESDVFGSFPLRYDPASGTWVGSTVVPPLAKGDYAYTVTAGRKDVADATGLVGVDPAVPLFAFRVSPRAPQPGRTVRVTVRALASVDEGDALEFEDGYRVVLPKPRGQVFGFTMRVWQRGLPYAATVVTKRGTTYQVVLR